MELEKIFEDCGLKVILMQEVHGGDINKCYCLSTPGRKYFLKVNQARQYPGMFEKEARGLEALSGQPGLKIPMVTRHGLVGDQQYLLLEWIEVGKGSTKVFKKAGSGLALLHGKVQPYFGFEEDNYIGNLHQDNRREESWELFYMERRLKPLVKKLFDAGAYSKADLLGTEKFYKNLENIFPKEPPSLLHGDLWSGNFMASVTDEPVLIDPAVYNGHREMDLAMTRLFGGFGEEFYRAYHETYPLEKGWEKRVPIAQLYPLLVHAVLFGGHYVAKTRDIFKRGR